MPYCIYLRKSRADVELEAQGEMETLARHEKALLDLAKRQGIGVSRIYKEIVSGETIASRPEMQKLLDDVESGQWDGVLVMEVERLARGDTIDQGIVAKAFKLCGTKIITPTKTYDPNNEFDEEYFEFGLFMSRREYKIINRRIQRGRIQSAKEGKFVGSTAPYGYDKVRVSNGKGYTLRPNEEAEILKSIFKMYLEGNGCSVIARKLDELHIPTRGGGNWSKASIQDMLRNPVYIGRIRWSYRVPDKTGKRDRIINQDCISVPGLHPPLIDPETFQRVQSMLDAAARLPVKREYVLRNPLSGLGYCSKCGSLLTRLGPNKHCPYDTIRCSNRYCCTVSAPLDLVEREVVRQITDCFRRYRITLQEQETPEDGPEPALYKSMSIIKQDIEKVEKQRAATYDLLEQGVYTTEVFSQRNQLLDSKLSELHSALEDVQRRIDEETHKADVKTELPKIEQILDGYYAVSDSEGRNAILRNVLVRFEYSKDEPNRRGGRNNCNFSIVVYPRLP